MLNVKSLLTIAKGGYDPAAFKGMLAAMGMDLAMSPVTLNDAPAALKQTAVSCSRRGASLHRLQGKMKDGAVIEAFIVLVPPAGSLVSAVTDRLVSEA
jgi:hypothetical protein